MIRLYNARILTLTNNMKIINGEVWIKDDKIFYVGKEKETNIEFEKEIDVKQNLLMPGFKNAHTHSAMVFLRSYADDLKLQDWLYNSVFPMEAKLKPNHIYYLTKLAIMEYLTSGITASFDMYFHKDEYVRANIDCGYRTVLCGAVDGGKENVKKLEEEYNKYNGYNPLISYILGNHAEYTADLGLLQEIGKLSNKYKAPVFNHNSETKKEVEECIAKYGKTPTALFEGLGMYNYGGGGFHCIYLNDEDLSIFERKNLSVITNPASNLKLSSGIAPVSKMLNMGINVGIGTDGAASNNSLNMFKEMFLVTGLQKYLENNPTACPAEEVLKMATLGGAKAMGLQDCNTIEPGKQADLIIIDLDQPNMIPIHNIIKNIVYSASKQNVIMTMVAGKILYENGEFFIGESKKEIYKNVDKVMEDLF